MDHYNNKFTLIYTNSKQGSREPFDFFILQITHRTIVTTFVAAAADLPPLEFLLYMAMYPVE